MDKIKKLSNLQILIGAIVFFSLAYLIFYDIPWVKHFANILGTIVTIALFIINNKMEEKKLPNSRLYDDGFDELSSYLTFFEAHINHNLSLFRGAVGNAVPLRDNNGFKYLNMDLKSENNKYVSKKINAVEKQFSNLEKSIKLISTKHKSCRIFEGFSDIKSSYDKMTIVMDSVHNQIGFIKNNLRPEIRDGKSNNTKKHLKYIAEGLTTLEGLTTELVEKADDFRDALENKLNKTQMKITNKKTN